MRISGRPARIVVVGGGIAGLAAAHRLRELSPDASITVLERSDRLGGKIRTESFAGMPVETGAETFLMRQRGAESAALGLARRVGLGDRLLHPTPVPAALALGGDLRPLPAGTLMGIPADADSVGGVAHITDDDHDDGAPLLAAGGDVAVGVLVRRRLGDDIVDRLVDPLLGGVYAGRADELSLAATIPGLHRTAAEHHTLAGAVRQALANSPRPDGSPVFATVHGGLTELVDAVTTKGGPDVHKGQTARVLQRVKDGWALVAGPTIEESIVEADAVILALPAAPAARLLRTVDETVADAVGALDYANVALVTLAFPPGTALPELSGFLVPPNEGKAVKAATFFTRKWAHLGGGPVLVRASVGRRGDDEALRLTDDALVDLVRGELPDLIGLALPEPVQARVNRWGGGLPQYAVGHLTRVATARTGLPATIALAGAAYDGVGIAACVRSGEAAAEAIQTALDG